MNGQLSIKSEWCSPFGAEMSARAGYHVIRETLSFLNSKEHILRKKISTIGTLIGAHITDRTFNFRDDDGNEYKGKLSPELNCESFEIPSRVRVEIEEEIKDNQYTGQELWSWTLRGISEVDA
jgi:hypothetical protein